jgi:polar amino acid transport system ATP-binding protein
LTPAVRFDAVSKRFGSTVVLDRFDFSVPRGEKVALIGPSGSGKSTLLRVLMTLERIDEGRVMIGDEVLWEVAEGMDRQKVTQAHLRRMRSRVGMVFQQFNLFSHMTALQNVASGPRHVMGLSRKEAEEIASALLAEVGLSDKLSSYPGSLSGGQQQLDPELVGEVLDVMRRLAHERDLTMLVVTHQMGVAREIADRVCFFEKGVIVEEGPPDQILTAADNPRTQAFLRAVRMT